MTILISSTGESPELWRDALATRLPDETIVLSPDEDEASRIDYAVVWQQPRGVLSRLPALTAIFSLGDVTGVFFGRDFISVTAAPGVVTDLVRYANEQFDTDYDINTMLSKVSLTPERVAASPIFISGLLSM